MIPPFLLPLLNKIVKGGWESYTGFLELFICYDIFTCTKKYKVKLTLKAHDSGHLLHGAAYQLQGITFHRQAKLSFKSKASGFKFKMVE